MCHVFSAPKSRDSMRKALEQLRKKELIVSEGQVKEFSGGKTRYKVYMYPDPNVQCPQTLSQTNSWALDAQDNNHFQDQCSQCLESPSGTEERALDITTSDISKIQVAQWDKSIKAGDKVLYVGRGDTGLPADHRIFKEVLTVLSVDHEFGVARVTSPNWEFVPNYMTLDLRTMRRI